MRGVVATFRGGGDGEPVGRVVVVVVVVEAAGVAAGVAEGVAEGVAAAWVGDWGDVEGAGGGRRLPPLPLLLASFPLPLSTLSLTCTPPLLTPPLPSFLPRNVLCGGEAATLGRRVVVVVVVVVVVA